MTYLIIPQLSFRDKDGNLAVEKDSNYVFNTKLSEALAYFNVKSVILLPNEFPKLFNTNPIYSRFTFDFESAEQAIQKHKPDVILENNPTNVMAWQAIKLSNKLDFKVYTYNHWLDTTIDNKVPHDILNYMYRQFDGHLYADKSGFNSNFAKNLFLRDYTNIIKYDISSLESKCYKLPPLMNIEELNKYKTKNKSEYIVFNHRLSELDYYNDNLNNLYSVLEHSETLRGYKIIFTNPTSKNIDKIVNRLKEIGMNKYEFVNLNRHDYLKMLSEAKLGFCLFERPGMWSISAMEINYYTSVIGLFHSGYSECLNPEFTTNTMQQLLCEIKYGTYVEEALAAQVTNHDIANEVSTVNNKYVKKFIQ